MSIQFTGPGKPALAMLACLIAAGALWAHANASEFPEQTLVTIKGDGKVVEFPAGKVWDGGPNMLYDALTPDGSMLLATSPSTKSVYAFDTGSGKQLAVIEVGVAPKGVKISPNGREAYISNEGENTVSVVDLRSFKVVGTIATEKLPHNVRFTRDGKTAYVTLQGGAGLGVIDTAARKLVRVIPVPGITGPHNLDLSPDEKTAWVRDVVHNVAVVDLPSGKVRKVIEVGGGHAGIDATPDGRYVFTGAIGDTMVSVIDPKTLSLVKQIDVGSGPHGVRASSDGHWLYVAVTGANKLVVIDIDSLEIANTLAVGKNPFWVAVRGNP